MNHTGRGVVVTGGSSGIGRAIADAFIANGDRVVVLDRAGTDELAIGVDVSQEDSVRAAFALARKRLGTIDILVNSAGLLTESKDRTKPWAKMSTALTSAATSSTHSSHRATIGPPTTPSDQPPR